MCWLPCWNVSRWNIVCIYIYPWVMLSWNESRHCKWLRRVMTLLLCVYERVSCCVDSLIIYREVPSPLDCHSVTLEQIVRVCYVDSVCACILLCFCTSSLVFWQYQYMEGVLYNWCCRNFAFAHNFSSDIRTFGLILYSAHVYLFDAVFW